MRHNSLMPYRLCRSPHPHCPTRQKLTQLAIQMERMSPLTNEIATQVMRDANVTATLCCSLVVQDIYTQNIVFYEEVDAFDGCRLLEALEDAERSCDSWSSVRLMDI